MVPGVSRNLLVSSFGISTDPAVEDVVPRRPLPDEKEGLFLMRRGLLANEQEGPILTTKGSLPDEKDENEKT